MNLRGRALAAPAPRLVAAVALALTVAQPLASPTPVRAAAAPIKVAIIVGPMGASTTAWNRQSADQLAQQATALGATVAKAYSPNATYAKVRAAVANANIIIYYGHGNGFPNPYSKKLNTDRNNGWGLNTTTTHGDADSWADHTLVYCGEKALQGNLVATDGADQRKYCAGGAIAPAPGFVMIYIGSCYTAGGNENGRAAATNAEARAHLAYFSRPMIGALGASGYFAGHAMGIMADLLANPDKSYGDIWNENLPGVQAAYDLPHMLVTGAREWLTRQSSDPYWEYAFAGDPSRTFNGGTSTFTPPTGTGDFYAPRITARTPAVAATAVSTSASVHITFNEYVKNSTTQISLWRGSTRISATVTYDTPSHSATLNPSAALAKGVAYVVKVGGSITDLAGNRLPATSWTFKT
jgi:hypothetical protein